MKKVIKFIFKFFKLIGINECTIKKLEIDNAIDDVFIVKVQFIVPTPQCKDFAEHWNKIKPKKFEHSFENFFYSESTQMDVSYRIDANKLDKLYKEIKKSVV